MVVTDTRPVYAESHLLSHAVAAALGANTFTVTGTPQKKTLMDVLPQVLSHLVRARSCARVCELRGNGGHSPVGP